MQERYAATATRCSRLQGIQGVTVVQEINPQGIQTTRRHIGPTYYKEFNHKVLKESKERQGNRSTKYRESKVQGDIGRLGHKVQLESKGYKERYIQPTQPRGTAAARNTRCSIELEQRSRGPQGIQGIQGVQGAT